MHATGGDRRERGRPVVVVGLVVVVVGLVVVAEHEVPRTAAQQQTDAHD